MLNLHVILSIHTTRAITQKIHHCCGWHILTLMNAVWFDAQIERFEGCVFPCLFTGRFIFFRFSVLSVKRQQTVQMLIMGASARLRHLQTYRDSRFGGMEGKPIHFSVSVAIVVTTDERKTWQITI